MTTSQAGRTAPWGKALGAVLLALLAAIIVAYSIANSRETDRKHSAFEATRMDARRFADTVVAQHNVTPTNRQDIQTALGASAGKGNNLLHSMQFTERRTKVVIQLTRSYQRSLALFSPAEATVDRCFTVVFEDAESRHLSVDITAHTADTRCSAVARQTS
ncbi:hypothetical protein OOK27_22700 [Streptomyces canus]|uniref:hypothetical protein n=1 Tax=Streptomyces canus TaxID=58343 RepID=UPI0022516779|nr:hypothetical protein [Streptomyces canus]MCX5256904.1 hypothetical protein [Streptomyces canus]